MKTNVTVSSKYDIKLWTLKTYIKRTCLRFEPFFGTQMNMEMVYDKVEHGF